MTKRQTSPRFSKEKEFYTHIKNRFSHNCNLLNVTRRFAYLPKHDQQVYSNLTSFDLELIKTNILIKFQKEWAKTVVSGMFTRFSFDIT